VFSRWLRVAEANSPFTLAQSTSSSSATICGSAVAAPCPISECGMRMVMVSSGSITIQAEISFAGIVSGLKGAVPSGIALARSGENTPSARPPPAESAVTTNWRRESDPRSGFSSPMDSSPRRFASPIEDALSPGGRGRFHPSRAKDEIG
jgi:hypothetical protein